MTPTSILRKVYFYRADVGCDPSGQPLPFDPTAALVHLNRLPYDPDGRYLEDGEVNLCCWVDRATVLHRLRFAQIRRAGLPQLERAGTLSDLHIPTDAGLAETIHIVVFPENIVGADFNFFGPRLSRFSLYLKEKAANQLPSVIFQPLLQQDVNHLLTKLQDIRLFQLRIRASYAEIIAQADADLGAAFAAAARAGEADELEIVLRPKRYSRSSLAAKLLPLARRLASLPDLRAESAKFQVKGTDRESGQVELVDILSDHLIAKVEILRQSQRGRTLNAESAYVGIESAYQELREDLRLAAGLLP